MDIEEYKKLAKNKIETDTLTQKVRDVIKMTKWEKQDAREGFKETFRPLIESQDSIKKSIDEQQNATIAQLEKNQLAITQGLNQNRLAITEGFDKMDEVKRWDLSQLPGPEAIEGPDEDDKEPSITAPASKESPITYDPEKNFDENELVIINEMGYQRPTSFLTTDSEKLIEISDELKKDVRSITGKITGLSQRKQKTEEQILQIENLQVKKNVLKKYKKVLGLYLDSLEYKIGQGVVYFNNPHQLLHRLKLLGGSILAGNNGVINEFSQIAHLLNKMKVITKKQLNDLLKNYIPIK